MQNAAGQSCRENRGLLADGPAAGLFFWTWTNRLLAVLERVGAKIPTVAIAIGLVLILVASVRISKGGYYAHPELERYIPHYLSNRPILQKIFDVNGVEIGPEFYRPRPLSYLADDLDVAFIAWSFRHGYPHFLSASYFVFWTLDCILLWFFFRKRLCLDRLSSGLVIALWSTAPVVFYYGVDYFRSAKPGGSFFMLAAFVSFVESFWSKRKNSNWKAAVLAGFGAMLLFSACLFDEIPIAYTVAAIVMICVQFLLARKSAESRALLLPLLGCIVVLGAFAYYDLVLHPKLVWAFSGAKVSTAYQTGTAEALLNKPGLFLVGSVSVFTDAAGNLMGRVSGIFGLVLFILLISVWQQFPRKDNLATFRRRLSFQRPLILVIAGTALMLICLYGMISRHPPILWMDVRPTLYVFPLTAVLLIFIAATLARSIQKRYLRACKLQLVLILIVVSNLVMYKTFSTFDHLQDPARGDARSVGFTKALLYALKLQARPDLMEKNHSSMSDFPKDVLNSRIYKALVALKSPQKSPEDK